MMDNLKAKMKTVLGKRKNRHQSSKSNKPLIENNNDMQDGLGYENPMANNAFNIAEERLQRLSQTPNDGYSRPVQPNSELQTDLSHILLKLPAELDQNLLKHLLDVMKALSYELQGIGLSFSEEKKRQLIDLCHRQIFAHLHNLLQNTSSYINCLRLMNWVSHAYMSQDMLGNPDQRLLDKWEAEANFKLSESLKKEISESLHKILQTHRSQKCHDAETYVGLYVDAIQCVDAKLLKFGSALYDQVRKICFQELLEFVKSYAAEQEELLNNEAETWKERKEKLETKLFLKTLKTCAELKKYVQPKRDDVQLSVLEETVEVLEDLETSAFNLLKEIVAEIAERGVKSYFKSGNWSLIELDTLSTHFPKLEYVSDEQKMVMNEAYKIFAHTYLKHLTKKRGYRRKLRPWISDGGITIYRDARYLHNTFSDLAPGVKPWNLMLCEIPEVLASKDIEGLKLTVAQLQKNCVEQSVCSEDLQLLPALLRWKGLSKQKVKEVLEALPDGPPAGDCATVETRIRTGSPFMCLICCC